MDIVEGLGYLASLLVFATFYMKTMIPLRFIAIGSNVAFIAYGIAEVLYPVIVLHAALLPLNVIRLMQVRRMIRHVEQSAKGEIDIKILLPFMSRSRHARGEVLFKKGEAADRMFYIASGTLRLAEFDVTLTSGDIIGEIGLFSPDNLRTATAVCDSPCLLYSLTAAKIYEHYYQNPAFALAIIRLITGRLVENLKIAGQRKSET